MDDDPFINDFDKSFNGVKIFGKTLTWIGIISSWHQEKTGETARLIIRQLTKLLRQAGVLLCTVFVPQLDGIIRSNPYNIGV